MYSELCTLYWLIGYFSSRYSSQPHTLRMYLPWYSCTHIFSCSADNSMLRVFFLMASAITCSGTQSWLIFNVYFCLSLLGDTITQMTTIIWPAFKRNNFKKTKSENFIPPFTLTASDKVARSHSFSLVAGLHSLERHKSPRDKMMNVEWPRNRGQMCSSNITFLKLAEMVVKPFHAIISYKENYVFDRPFI